ncbi:hypothetical protein AAGW05_16115 [Arthrobacter sp. LAPM80]|uniref:hypothetical protein n=1 Tax=Arthrobacter sp. LAPM80 TaxID=3141788 RepID=UPI00398AF5A9
MSNHVQRIAELEQQLAAFANERAEDFRMALRMIEGTRPEQPAPGGARRWRNFGRRNG